jgi:hypothetical protein
MHDNEEVIKNFLELVRKETGVKVDRRMVAAVPDWNIFNNPKEIPRSKKKPVVFEEPAEVEDAENENKEQGENDENDNIDELVDNPENTRAAEETDGTSERQEVVGTEKKRVDNVEKERRTKKRNERPLPFEEEKTAPARATKRIKTVVPRPSKKAVIQGKVSEPKTNSMSEAQNQPPPSTTINYTKPLRMIVPTQISSSSSSSSDSSSSSSEETVVEVFRVLASFGKISLIP